jgi:uncharacterized membrane protein
MPTLYNRIQGRNLDRLAALSDGIFAFGMTLLVLDLHLPSAAQRARTAGCLGSAGAAVDHVWHELSNAGHLLGWATDAA